MPCARVVCHQITPRTKASSTMCFLIKLATPSIVTSELMPLILFPLAMLTHVLSLLRQGAGRFVCSIKRRIFESVDNHLILSQQPPLLLLAKCVVASSRVEPHGAPRLPLREIRTLQKGRRHKGSHRFQSIHRNASMPLYASGAWALSGAFAQLRHPSYPPLGAGQCNVRQNAGSVASVSYTLP